MVPISLANVYGCVRRNEDCGRRRPAHVRSASIKGNDRAIEHALTEMMIGPITSVAALLSLQVLYVLPAAYTFPQSIDNVATSEICRFVAAGSLQMQEVKNNKETFREHEEYINEWVINIIEGSDVADEIAEKHGFLNVGLVSFSSLLSV